MDLSTVRAPHLAQLADEEVVPLAADLARDLADLDSTGQHQMLGRLFEVYQHSHHTRRQTLLQLLGAGLAILAALPRTARLAQTPAHTRVTYLTVRAYAAFMEGRRRHLVFQLGTWSTPREGDVVRVLERGPNGTGSSGHETFAEILDVSECEGQSYVVSVRPWRGAGTESAEQGREDARREALSVAVDAVERLTAVLQQGTTGSRLANIANAALAKLVSVDTPQAIAAE